MLERKRGINCIEIAHLSKSIKQRQVLNDISLNIERNSICGFIGPNGSGKTMLFRAIAGFLNVPLESIQRDKNMSMGVIIENPAFINNFTGFENLAYLASIKHCITEKQIKSIMEQIQLDPDDHRRVKEYSLGMKQKLAVVQAVMEKPELLILDEPTRGLDESGINCVHSILREQHKNGVTILIASHDKADIKSLCQHVFYLEEGRLVKTD